MTHVWVAESGGNAWLCSCGVRWDPDYEPKTVAGRKLKEAVQQHWEETGGAS